MQEERAIKTGHYSNCSQLRYCCYCDSCDFAVAFCFSEPGSNSKTHKSAHTPGNTPTKRGYVKMKLLFFRRR